MAALLPVRCVPKGVLHLTAYVYVVVVAFSPLARILGECSTSHFPPVLCFLNGD